MTHDVTCSSCGAVLGAVDLPDDTPPDRVAAATHGTLCESCGAAYAHLVGTDATAPGQIPAAATIAATVETLDAAATI